MAKEIFEEARVELNLISLSDIITASNAFGEEEELGFGEE